MKLTYHGVALILAIAAFQARARSLWPRLEKSPRAVKAVSDGDRNLALARELTLAGETYEGKQYGELALKEYEDALSITPRDAEVHYRAFIAARHYADDWEAVLRHVDGVRAADPMDPREMEITEEACHALAHLAARGGSGAAALLERGVREYDHWLALADEEDPFYAPLVAINYANAAELAMALGRLDEAIPLYLRAVDIQGMEALPRYGLAVALDRDGQEEKARMVMKQALEMDSQMAQLHKPGVYFVPDGEIHYYEALAYQVAGKNAAAISSYQDFLARTRSENQSYLQRARAHLDDLGVRKTNR